MSIKIFFLVKILLKCSKKCPFYPDNHKNNYIQICTVYSNTRYPKSRRIRTPEPTERVHFCGSTQNRHPMQTVLKTVVGLQHWGFTLNTLSKYRKVRQGLRVMFLDPCSRKIYRIAWNRMKDILNINHVRKFYTHISNTYFRCFCFLYYCFLSTPTYYN